MSGIVRNRTRLTKRLHIWSLAVMGIRAKLDLECGRFFFSICLYQSRGQGIYIDNMDIAITIIAKYIEDQRARYGVDGRHNIKGVNVDKNDGFQRKRL